MRRHVRLASVTIAMGILISSCGHFAHTHANVAISSRSCSALEYGGKGKPDALIVSDLPMRGDSAQRSAHQVEAIRLALDEHGWHAGHLNIAFQACDDSLASTRLWDPVMCKANAEAYAADLGLLGVIGTYNSGCAAVEIPILNGAGVAMISPGNTNICLTDTSPQCTGYSPSTLYPAGRRNYARVIPNDAYQGAGLATFASSQGVKKPYLLYAAGDPTSTGQAEDFRGAAAQIGLPLAGFTSWDPKAKSYAGLFAAVKRSGADGVVLAGLLEENGVRLLQDKAAVLGSNDTIKVFAFDGFTQQSIIDRAGAAAAGMFASVPGRSKVALSKRGLQFLAELQGRLSGQTVEVFAPYAGEAAEVLLAAIGKAGFSRSGVIRAVFATKRTNGILGTYRFESNGDPSAGPVTVFRAAGTFKTFELVTPTLATVAAARAGAVPAPSTTPTPSGG